MEKNLCFIFLEYYVRYCGNVIFSKYLINYIFFFLIENEENNFNIYFMGFYEE